jgi:tRNA 2-selenouridine synthase
LAFTLTDTKALVGAGFDTIIDVRSPAEFAEDHVPGAVSMPVLSDAERAEVGTIYTQQSPFRARMIGAALVARNAARHIEDRLMATMARGVRWSIAGAAGSGRGRSRRSSARSAGGWRCSTAVIARGGGSSWDGFTRRNSGSG